MSTDATPSAVPTTAHRWRRARSEPSSRLRTWLFRVPAALVVAVMGLTGGHELVTAASDDRGGGAFRVQDLHWGVIEGLLLAGMMVVGLRRPARHAGAMRVALVAVLAQLLVLLALVTVDLWTATFAVLVVLAALAHPARGAVVRPALAVDARRLGLGAVVAAGLLAFAVDQVVHEHQLSAGAGVLVTTGWVGAAFAATALALTALMAGLVRSAAASWAVGLSLAVLGVGSLLHPALASSFGLAGGAAAVAGALAAVVTAPKASGPGWRDPMITR